MGDDPLVLLLTRSDTLTGAPCPLRAAVRAVVEPPLAAPLLSAHVIDALEAAMGLGQSRYQIHRDEMPSRTRAVEDGARAALAASLAGDGHRLVDFALERLEPA
jgi:hypothetical protein